MSKVLPPAIDRPSIGARLRASIASKFDYLVDLLGVVGAASGATFAAVFGKVILGMVLAGFSLGFLLRLKGRGRVKESAIQKDAPSGTSRLVAATLALFEVAILVEATNLPVRYDQDGFQVGYWYLVVLAVIAAYCLQLPALCKMLGRWGVRGAV